MHNEVVHDFLVAEGLLSSTSFKALAQTNRLQALIESFLIILSSSYTPPIITQLST